MSELSTEAKELTTIAADLRFWHVNKDTDSRFLEMAAYNDLARAQERLEDLVHDIAKTSFVELSIGDTEQDGSRFYGMPYGFEDERPETAVAGSVLSLDYVRTFRTPHDRRLSQEMYFGNVAIYFATRSLARAIAEGSSLSIEPLEAMPHYRSYRRAV